VRYLPLVLWATCTIWFLFIVASDFMFGKGDPKTLAKRIGLALVWPIAIFSKPGRALLLKMGDEL
jgi:hypothetical protein